MKFSRQRLVELDELAVEAGAGAVLREELGVVAARAMTEGFAAMKIALRQPSFELYTSPHHLKP